MRVQITVVLTDGKAPARVESMTLKGSMDDKVIANAARQLARQAGLGRPTPASEGGRG